MLTKDSADRWSDFLSFMRERCSATEFQNWLAPIKAQPTSNPQMLTLEVPNIFVQEYLLQNYKKELLGFAPVHTNGDLAIQFVITPTAPSRPPTPTVGPSSPAVPAFLNPHYTFDGFIAGPSNQFVKSASLGIAAHPGKSYNPLFIYGGVGLGKTHLLHAIGNAIAKNHRTLSLRYTTTEGFINDIKSGLESKGMQKIKSLYRSFDVLLIDDIQFLEPPRISFEAEFCHTIESLTQQGKQVVITSDKPPSQLKLSERTIARMECGLVANVAPPDLETRVAILQYKAEQRGVRLPPSIALFIARHIFHNVRQLEGALNRLAAFSRMINKEVTEDVVKSTLGELFQSHPNKHVSVDAILKTVSTIFEVRVSDLKSASRAKEVTLPRQVAMYLAKELMSDSLITLASAFGGKTHSTLLHAWKKIQQQLQNDESLRQQVEIVRTNLQQQR